MVFMALILRVFKNVCFLDVCLFLMVYVGVLPHYFISDYFHRH